MAACACVYPKIIFVSNVEVMEPLAKHYCLNHEMVSFQAESAARYLKNKHEAKSLSDVMYHLLPRANDAFVNLLKVLQIVLTLGVSTASCERSVSCLNV